MNARAQSRAFAFAAADREFPPSYRRATANETSHKFVRLALNLDAHGATQYLT
jgi:hypothetical protein